ncbi:MAG TPA: glycosyltransferase family 2 protein [Candidatus Dojkabacteria bacterium]|nr:glycosyltransferase family 2 protein [Candidatus Dojkabacteria bacterium]
MEKQPLVAIIIVTWNNQDEIRDCLDSIKRSNYEHHKVVIVDNASKDSTTEIIDQEYSEFDLIKNEKNSHFTGGNNIGFKYAIEKYNPDFLMKLNPDTIIDADVIHKLVQISQKDHLVGAVGPKIKFKGGKNDGKINSASLFYDNFHSAYDLGFGEVDQGQFNETKEVFAVTGTCILFRTEVIKKTGGFWEILKMYTDEVELLIRVHKLGWKVIYTGEVTVWHKYMKSTNQEHETNYDKLKMRNWLLIALRHYSIRDRLRMIRDYLKFIF